MNQRVNRVFLGVILLSMLHWVFSANETLVGLPSDTVIDGVVLLGIGVLAFTVLRSPTPIGVPKLPLGLLLVLYLSLIASTLSHIIQTGWGAGLLLKAIAYILVSLLLVVISSGQISIRYQALAMSRVSAVTVIVGIFGLLVGGFSIFGITIGSWFPFEQFIPWVGSVRVPVLLSVFYNPNQYSFLLLIGTVAGVYEVDQFQSPIAYGLLLINAFGLYLAHSRAAMVTAGVAVFIYLLSRQVSSQQPFAPIVVLSGAIGAGFLVALLIVVPDVIPVDLNGRVVLWQATVDSIQQRPLLGWGLQDTGEVIQPFTQGTVHDGKHPHNSYLRMFLDGGVVAGVAYIMLTVMVLMRCARSARQPNELLTLSLVFSVIIIQVFELFTLFGIHTSAIITAVLYGNAISAPTASEQSDDSVKGRFERCQAQLSHQARETK